ncbi:hypothetical protein LR48_Vigan01g098700 [Vigna angularis]|uniref:Uncharacterized protein n=1 Tax=Phaseolus angularis TaxID=3914 RepID=A0A0L9TLU9_PHAAN|nr:hypothetical protein LR48_Vigan01g098700 [Vigna angularis]
MNPKLEIPIFFLSSSSVCLRHPHVRERYSFPSLLPRCCSAIIWQLPFSHVGTTRDSFGVVRGGGACERHSGRGATLGVSMVVRAVGLERQGWPRGMVRLLRPGSSAAKDGASGLFLQRRSLVFVILPLPSIWFDDGEIRKAATLFCGLGGLAACLRSSPTMEPRRFLRSVMDKPLSFSGAVADGGRPSHGKGCSRMTATLARLTARVSSVCVNGWRSVTQAQYGGVGAGPIWEQ